VVPETRDDLGFLDWCESIPPDISGLARIRRIAIRTNNGRTTMSKRDGGILTMIALCNLHRVPHERWHIETAWHLRSFAEQIETHGLQFGGDGAVTWPALGGEIVTGSFESEDGRGLCGFDVE
jgi:hypothetical protein